MGNQNETFALKRDVLEDLREKGIVLTTESGLLRMTWSPAW